MESIIGAGLIDDAVKYLDEVKLRRLKVHELRLALEPRMKELEGMRVKAAREAIGTIGPIPSIKLDT